MSRNRLPDHRPRVLSHTYQSQGAPREPSPRLYLRVNGALARAAIIPTSRGTTEPRRCNNWWRARRLAPVRVWGRYFSYRGVSSTAALAVPRPTMFAQSNLQLPGRWLEPPAAPVLHACLFLEPRPPGCCGLSGVAGRGGRGPQKRCSVLQMAGFLASRGSGQDRDRAGRRGPGDDPRTALRAGAASPVTSGIRARRRRTFRFTTGTHQALEWRPPSPSSAPWPGFRIPRLTSSSGLVICWWVNAGHLWSRAFRTCVSYVTQQMPLRSAPRRIADYTLH